MTDYDDMFRHTSNPWPEKKTQINLKFECKGCHGKVDKWYSQANIDTTPGCKEFCLPCLMKRNR